LIKFELFFSYQCQENPRIVEALQFAELLESCRFQEFWVIISD
jgi:hypothetical protein